MFVPRQFLVKKSLKSSQYLCRNDGLIKKLDVYTQQLHNPNMVL